MDQQVELSNEVLFRELAGEAVLLDLKSQRYFGLDEVGTRIWQLLAEHRTTGPVLAAMIAEYDAEPAVLAADLETFLARLEAAELIHLSPTAGPREA